MLLRFRVNEIIAVYLYNTLLWNEKPQERKISCLKRIMMKNKYCNYNFSFSNRLNFS